MKKLNIPVALFDPQTPRRGIEIDAGMDTFGKHILVTRAVISTFKNLETLGNTELSVGNDYDEVKIRADIIKLGVRIGTIRINNLEAVIVDSAPHELILNIATLERCFTVGISGDQSVNLSSGAKDDRTALTIEVCPLEKYVELRAFEELSRNQRILHNLFLVALGKVQVRSPNDLANLIENESGIPPELRLSLRWVESGSIWMTLKSGSADALKYLSSLFKGGTSATLAQRQADSQNAEVETEIAKKTSAAVIRRRKQEEERKRSEQLSQTYQIWRDEIRDRIAFFDELLLQISDENLAKEMAMQKDQALVKLTNQQLLPLVAFAPIEDATSPDEGIPFLPSPEESDRGIQRDESHGDSDSEILRLPPFHSDS
ncbi:MAG: hypothetical protein QNJ72_40800 [Pleurocapsa sp. MO_226.B13]|nr:hypothetical protein [Pleurocapsa sp. MO_226.B13]